MKVKKTKDLTLHDILSQLTTLQAQKCLGLEISKLIAKVSNWAKFNGKRNWLRMEA